MIQGGQRPTQGAGLDRKVWREGDTQAIRTTKRCPACKGEGRVILPAIPNRPSRAVDCKPCNGSGELPRAGVG